MKNEEKKTKTKSNICAENGEKCKKKKMKEEKNGGKKKKMEEKSWCKNWLNMTYHNSWSDNHPNRVIFMPRLK